MGCFVVTTHERKHVDGDSAGRLETDHRSLSFGSRLIFGGPCCWGALLCSGEEGEFDWGDWTA